MRVAMLGVKGVPAIGGIARYVEELGSRLAERGHEVTVYCRPHYTQEGSNGEYRGMRRVVTGGLKGKHLDALSHTFTAALRAARGGYDVLHVHGCGPGALAPLLKLAGRAKIVLTVHGLDWQRSKWGRQASWMFYRGAAASARWVDGVVTVGGYIRDFYAEQLHRPARMIPTGMDQAVAPPAEEITGLGLEPGGYLLCAARFVPEKGLHHLVDAFRRTETDRKLVIAGDWRYADSYARDLMASGDERIVFPGYVTGRLLAELYGHCYVYVQPSLLEGVSVSVLEALSYGRCVLASDIPGNREALGPCGYLHRPGDVEDLRGKLEWLLAHPGDVASQHDVASDYIAHERSWDSTTDEYEALYESLTGVLTPARPIRQTETAYQGEQTLPQGRAHVGGEVRSDV